MDKTKLGSKTAKGGFANEKAICKKFNNWKKDKEAQIWLSIMGYKGEVKVSPKGSLYIGKITMQRKGGTPDPTKLQSNFKSRPWTT